MLSIGNEFFGQMLLLSFYLARAIYSPRPAKVAKIRQKESGDPLDSFLSLSLFDVALFALDSPFDARDEEGASLPMYRSDPIARVRQPVNPPLFGSAFPHFDIQSRKYIERCVCVHQSNSVNIFAIFFFFYPSLNG